MRTGQGWLAGFGTVMFTGMNTAQDNSPVALRRTARLALRPPGPADLDFLVGLFARPELVAHRPHPEPDSAEACAARLERDMAHWRRYGFGRWAVELDGTLIGFGGLTRKAGFEGLNLSYHLHPDAWGQGYASELAAEALAVAFRPLAARKVIGLVRPANPESRHVLERAGFLPEAEVMLDGAPSLLLARHP
ncbi:GNAT family N-acetyltransferase [Roseomonas xinghualingensis]|uniref:GNAT family N-acetyltransferase n=1 Tax=Roseomonas xinghualingensis TaxID=2986475 RepID=UPI0021F0B979|nr:GNAT family N-acetyltransferase [Roseomonas sp. SXEYE001]MCV4206069.1 GNAT family N-acetyltransferase [Roseomonas sp. SXEYE001]